MNILKKRKFSESPKREEFLESVNEINIPKNAKSCILNLEPTQLNLKVGKKRKRKRNRTKIRRLKRLKLTKKMYKKKKEII